MEYRESSTKEKWEININIQKKSWKFWILISPTRGKGEYDYQATNNFNKLIMRIFTIKIKKMIYLFIWNTIQQL